MTDDIDLTRHFNSPLPSYMLVRWEMQPEDVTSAEREEAAAAGITDIEDFGIGLFYNRQADAETVAHAMAKRIGIRFGVYREEDGIAAVFMP